MSENHRAALQQLNASIEADAHNLLTRFQRSMLHQLLAQPEQALADVQIALELEPHHPEVLNLRGTIYLDLKLPSKALADFQQAAQLAPQYATAFFNWGSTLQSLGQLENAIACFDQALAIEPQFVQALSNKGTALHALNRPNDALACYDQALMYSPDLPDVQWNKALSLLTLGDFKQGWPLYEYRWQTQGFMPRTLPSTRWLGETRLQGKRIHIYAEQGLGDTIQFLRYLRPLAQTGAIITLEVHSSLLSLAQKIPHIAQVIALGEPPPACDVHCALMSLPLALGLDLPISATELGAALQASSHHLALWNNRLGAKTKPRIGLVMHGNLRNEKDALRSIAAPLWLKHLPPEFDYVLLHERLSSSQREHFETQENFHYFGDHITSFEDTAALCQLMDVVVSVDTSVAHLSASLGRPTWLVLPHAPDWRWQLERTDSPWYASMRLFRQAQATQWTEALQSIAHELSRFLLLGDKI
jgi:Tfp pilus assembly protein PilF